MPLSEFELIEKYFRNLTSVGDLVVMGIGDDAAILNIPPGKQLVTSVDTLVSGIHFSTDMKPDDIGYKSLAVNISDLAAMGAQPYWATLSLTLPENNPDWIRGFTRGFSAPAANYGISLVGGDLTHGPLSITVQIMGLVDENQALTRSGAEAGDIIYVSGCLGGAGLALLYLRQELNAKARCSQACFDRLLRPEPRVKLGRELAGLATSAIDISDGLAADLGHILAASGKGATIYLDRIPLCDDLLQIEERDLKLQIALSAGDDYELCFTVPEIHQDRIEQISRDLGIMSSRVGVINDGRSIRWLNADESEYKLKTTGYCHF